MDDNSTRNEHKKHRHAGRILAEVMEKTAKKIIVGASILETAVFAEDLIRDLGGKPAFPCNLSINEDAAHYTPGAGDTSVFGEDMIKLDIGVHIDGYIADAAVTIDLSDHPELVEASKAGLAAAIDLIHAGIDTAEIGAAIEGAISEFGYKPIANLTGHGLERYRTHAPPSIPNIPTRGGITLREGQVVAIEPFATKGAGRIRDTPRSEIYHLATENPPLPRIPRARALLQEMMEYKTLPFAKRWFSGEKIDFTFRSLEKSGLIESYPVLTEVTGALVSQAEHTVIVTTDGCEVITG
ncbi:MAG TPA: type II methionyl aminopeptidase [Methanosarcinales archaeon]|nr:type II methionyl aminopeptidase [Methanosarcinales archaeon]